MAGPLLVMRGANHSDDNSQNDAENQRERRDVQRTDNAGQILCPAVVFDERLIEVYIELLPRGHGIAGGDHRFPQGILFQIGHLTF